MLSSCRTREGTQYLASVAVIWTEVIKLAVCLTAQLIVAARTARSRGLSFRDEAAHQMQEVLGRSWPMLVPAALFVMQQARTPACAPQPCDSLQCSHPHVSHPCMQSSCKHSPTRTTYNVG